MLGKKIEFTTRDTKFKVDLALNFAKELVLREDVDILVGTIIASLENSAVSWLYYADRIYQLPLGIVGIAIGIVLLPDLSKRLRAGDREGAATSLNRSLEVSLFFTLPAAVALFVVPEPIIQVLFQRGAFSAGDAAARPPRWRPSPSVCRPSF